MKGKVQVVKLGKLNYREALVYQEKLANAKRAAQLNVQSHPKIPNTLLLVEHSPVYTMGKRDESQDIKQDHPIFTQEKVELIKTNRGGASK